MSERWKDRRREREKEERLAKVETQVNITGMFCSFLNIKKNVPINLKPLFAALQAPYVCSDLAVDFYLFVSQLSVNRVGGDQKKNLKLKLNIALTFLRNITPNKC